MILKLISNTNKIEFLWSNIKFIVKLHSELANPTELQLDGVGVDFVFPPSQLSNNK